MKLIIAGAKPDVNEVRVRRPDFLNLNQFVEMLNSMFELDYRKRPSAKEVHNYIDQVFSRPGTTITRQVDESVGENLIQRAVNSIHSVRSLPESDVEEEIPASRPQSGLGFALPLEFTGGEGDSGSPLKRNRSGSLERQFSPPLKRK